MIDTEETFYLSVLSLFEIKKKFLKDKINLELIEENMNFIKSKSIILDVTEEIIDLAVKVSFEKDIPMTDSLIYATAIHQNAFLITLDNDFRGLEKVKILQ